MEDIRLLAATTNFFIARIKKLEKKEKQGHCGWEYVANEAFFRDEIRTRAKKRLTQKNLVDIANYCSFLWEMLEGRKAVGI